ncbi:acetyl-/propionyl-CoA carboxylase subunit alpha, partial [Micrococcus endophyticus]
ARALGEAEIAGMASVLPFHRAVVADPAFAPEIVGSSDPFSVHTRWIETEFENLIEPSEHAPADPTSREPRRTVTVEVNGKRVDVTLPTWGEALHTISG